MKVLLNDETFKRVHGEWKAHLQEELTAAVAKLQADEQTYLKSDYQKTQIQWEVRALIARVVHDTIHTEIARIVEDQKRYFAKDIQRCVEVAMQQNVAKLVEDGIQRRLKAAQGVTKVI